MLRGLLRLRVWVAEVLRPSDRVYLLAWAVIIGVAGALAALLFRAATAHLHELLTGVSSSDVDSFRQLVPWKRVLVPAAGGLAAGCFLYFGTRLRRRDSSTDYMEAIVVGNGDVAFRGSLVKSLSALFSGASGASIGHEGPMVQLAAMLSSLPGRWRRLSVPMRRQLVACGAAAGIASAYNAPIGGAFFVAEIVLGSLAFESFGPLVVSSVVATLVTRASLGPEALYETPPFLMTSAWELVPYLILGLLCGFLAPLYLRFLRASERVFLRLPVHGMVRLGLGGVIVGGLALSYPEVCGNGYGVLNEILHTHWAWRVLLAVLLFKLVATGATFGSGAVGGVFTPTMLVGGAFGQLFGTGVGALVPHAGLEPSACALVGVGAFLAATTGAPVMAIIVLFELTLNYAIILPLMLACVLAYTTCRAFERHFLYGVMLERKGASLAVEQLRAYTVADLIRPDPPAVRMTGSFREIAEAFLQNRFQNLYVVDDQGRFRGVVSLHDVKAYLDRPALGGFVIAADLLTEEFPTITLAHPLEAALDTFEAGLERLPVLDDATRRRLVGSLSKTDLLLHLIGRRQTSRPGAGTP